MHDVTDRKTHLSLRESMSQLVQSNNPSKDALALASDEGYGGSLPLDDLKEGLFKSNRRNRPLSHHKK